MIATLVPTDRCVRLRSALQRRKDRPFALLKVTECQVILSEAKNLGAPKRHILEAGA